MDIVSVFGEFFLLLYIALLIICALLLIGFARRSVKRKMYEIGVLRALGCRNRTVAFFFMRPLFEIAIFIAAISVTSVLILEPILNEILISNLALLLDTAPIKELKILHFNLLSAGIDVITVTLLSFISSLIIIRSCKKIKPINIIRNSRF